ncbi:hypothetical protein HY416_02775 [Candidatus Kaiserbacteria bacterium]|nr:hypothetical protein [Candidatus Kaiserbacteria bacterium]
MKDFSDNEIRTAYKATSDTVRDVIFSTTTTATIGAISAQNGIPEDKMYLVAEEVLFALIGLTGPHEVAPRLQERLGIDPLRAQQIAHSIFVEIFDRNKIAMSALPQTAPAQPPIPAAIERNPATISAATPQQMTPRPTPQPAPQPPRPTQSIQPPRPVPQQAPPSAQPILAPIPRPAAPPPAWTHVQTRPQPPQSAPPTNLPTQAPATPPIPSYQKPLTQVPEYRNANLYQKPHDGAPQGR